MPCDGMMLRDQNNNIDRNGVINFEYVVAERLDTLEEERGSHPDNPDNPQNIIDGCWNGAAIYSEFDE